MPFGLSPPRRRPVLAVALALAGLVAAGPAPLPAGTPPLTLERAPWRPSAARPCAP